MAVKNLANTNATGLNLFTGATVDTYTTTADGWVCGTLYILGLNAAASTLTVKVVILDASDVQLGVPVSYSMAKDAAANTTAKREWGPVRVRSGEKVRVTLSSTNSSDTTNPAARSIIDDAYAADTTFWQGVDTATSGTSGSITAERGGTLATTTNITAGTIGSVTNAVLIQSGTASGQLLASGGVASVDVISVNSNGNAANGLEGIGEDYNTDGHVDAHVLTIANDAITGVSIAANALNGKGDWLLASGYTAPDNAGISTISSNVTTLLNRIGAFTGSGVNTVLGFLKAVMSKAASTPSDVGGTFDAATDSLEAIKDSGVGSGTGSGSNVVTVTTNVGSVKVTLKGPGADAPNGTTSAGGSLTLGCTNAAYEVIIHKDGYTLGSISVSGSATLSGNTVTISGTATVAITLTAISSAAPAQPGICRVYDTAKNATGAAASGVVYKWRIIDGEARVYPGNTYTATSSGTGENNIYFDVAQGATVAVKRGAGLRGREDRGEIIIDVPATSTAQLEDLIERAVVGLDE